ncbi:CoA pyrophosphatase [Shewanella sp. NIFS-20-20]|uniref:CoA pyrophosphatase n=1 Tax=Shewanella sp. NIFS-20-20 TaxID=2853806 RepID=UPI001C43E675|nr:CoA pyrophosphatase [Shewanella sp. NIFS-20-20]MBV7315060.1 CoA pyrophosphatase [Shewanella sp. NIFS-20-20]
MHLNELKTRFLLHAAQSPAAMALNRSASSLVSAAVLVPFFQAGQDTRLLLTRRAAHLAAHPGQISFPGGKREPQDSDLIDTALRESYEEIGLIHDQVEVLGTLDVHQTISGFTITPVVGIIHGAFTPIIDSNEVAEWFSVPWQHLMQTEHRHQAQFRRQGHTLNVGFIPYQDKFIWGATAAIIDQLALQLSSVSGSSAVGGANANR